MEPQSAFSKRWFLIAVGAYVAGLILYGHFGHEIQAVGNENDDYVGMAERILRGDLPVDPYRPMLYPLLVAGMGGLLGDCFAAAKIISSMFAGLLVGSGYLLARQCFGPRVALLTAALSVCNGWILTMGIAANTDMIFAGSSMLCLWLAARMGSGGSAGRVLGLAAAFALAYFSRYQSSLLMLAVLPALWLAPGSGSGTAPDLRTRLKRLLVFGAGACLFLIPHFVLNTLTNGSPLHSENWRTIAIKHFADMDFEQLGSMPFDGTLSVLLHDPARLLSQGFAELSRFVTWGYPRLLSGGTEMGGLGISLALVSLIGFVMLLRSRKLLSICVFGYGIAYLLVVSMLFTAAPRISFAVLPLMYGLVALAFRPAFEARGLFRAAGWLIAIGALLGVALSSISTIERLHARHPFAELELAAALPERLPYPPRLLSTYGHLRRYVPVDAVLVRPPYLRFEVEEYVQRLVAEAEQSGREFIVLGAVSVGADRYQAILDNLPPRLSIESQNDQAAILRVAGVALDWIAGAEVSPNPYSQGPLSLRIELRPEVDLSRVARVMIVARRQAGGRMPLFLRLGPDRAFSLTLDSPQFARGPWTLTPVVLDKSGRFGSAPPIPFQSR